MLSTTDFNTSLLFEKKKHLKEAQKCTYIDNLGCMHAIYNHMFLSIFEFLVPNFVKKTNVYTVFTRLFNFLTELHPKNFCTAFLCHTG